MKSQITKIVQLIGILFLNFSFAVQAQYKEKNYANTPDKFVPYGNFQDAYIKHFMEPYPFFWEPVGKRLNRLV